MGKHSQKWFFWHSVLFIFIMRQSCICVFTYLNHCVVHYLEDELCCKDVFVYFCTLLDYPQPSLLDVALTSYVNLDETTPHPIWATSTFNKWTEYTFHILIIEQKTGNGSIFSFSLTTSTFTHGSHPMESTLYRTENIIARSFIFSCSAEFSALFAFIVVSCLWGKF